MKPREEGPSLIDCAAPQADVAGLVARATQAHQVLMQGDIAQYRASMPLADDFTLMAPFGGPPTRDGRYTDEAWAAIGRFFRAGRDSTFELVRAYRSSELVCLAAIERSHVEVGGLPGQDWALRVTLVFRKDGERWLLVHRHADPLVGAISLTQSAALARAPR
jgi:ketosteroid isomerase-like protein